MEERDKELAQEALDAISHYGVKGMRWGVRKDRSGGGSSGRAGGKTAQRKGNRDHADAKLAAKLKQRKVSELSNEQLSKLNKRLNLEREHKRLTAKERSAGRKIVEEVMKDIAKSTLAKYAKLGIQLVDNKLAKRGAGG